jgi:hypothetical protein
MKSNIPDLRKETPRSPHIKLGKFVHLARMIDKARAKETGVLGEYIYPCPLDQNLLEFLNIDDKKFLDITREQDDNYILTWLRKNGRGHTSEEIKRWNHDFLDRKPLDEDEMKRFNKIRKRIAPDRKDITTWINLLDLDEGRTILPRNGKRRHD